MLYNLIVIGSQLVTYVYSKVTNEETKVKVYY